MASPTRISLVLKLLFFALLLISSTVSATDNIPLLHNPPIRKMVGKVVAVPKVKKPTSDDVPWGGGYVPPILINP
ncbi:unnamed protein product [Citrullus colocynthis]|uniref:Transmembrane protein n=1 Tax=Citrullus colocynthis TaxID=252529 RepID=A0ABP0YEH5_9ROSI